MLAAPLDLNSNKKTKRDQSVLSLSVVKARCFVGPSNQIGWVGHSRSRNHDTSKGGPLIDSKGRLLKYSKGGLLIDSKGGLLKVSVTRLPHV